MAQFGEAQELADVHQLKKIGEVSGIRGQVRSEYVEEETHREVWGEQEKRKGNVQVITPVEAHNLADESWLSHPSTRLIE